MGKYVDGYVLPVKKDKLDEYKKLAGEAGNVWLKYGALQYFECVGEDMKPDVGGAKMRTFPEIVSPGEDEVIIFAFVVYESRAHRDEVNGKVMSDPEFCGEENKNKSMPFDMTKMVFGGFESIVGLSKEE